jgi:glycosyltransferase involved in cell wall biosynthesis
MKTLLVIGYVWPEPNSSAAGARMLQLIQFFQKHDYAITYASPATPSDHAIDYEYHGISTAEIELNNTSFDEFIQNLNPQVVLFDRFMMEEQFGWRVEKYCPNAIRILDTEDLHCLRYARQSLAKGNKHVIKDVPIQALYSDHAKREIASIYRCDLTLMISQYEMNLLTQTFSIPEQILLYLPFLVEKSNLPKKPYEEREHFISIGNFRHEPNWDAVLQLKQEIWPIIRKQLPNAQLHVYGAYPPKKATQLHNEKQGFIVKGWCENAYDVLLNAKVLLAPLRFGAGLKGKLIDAAQCNLPAITTSIGAEGLDYGSSKQPFLWTDDYENFANLAIQLYSISERWRDIQERTSSFIGDNFSKVEFESQLKNKLTNIIEDLNKHRLSNFTGSMLRHHSMKSTQYMAQWIEAKNKLN